MRTEVMFRDLPGGPVPVEFCDEIPRRNKCSSCQMISLKMYADEKGHVFCDSCVCAASDLGHIYCNTESRNVPLMELFDAYQVLLILRSMAVCCPNKARGCEEVEKLETIADHYERCKYTTIDCTVCKAKVAGREYKQHRVQCSPMVVQCSRCCAPVEKKELPRHKCRKQPGDQHEPEQWTSLPHQDEFRWQSQSPSSLPCQSEQRVQPVASSLGGKVACSVASKTEGPDEEKVTCKLCSRQVRKSNLQRHLAHCEDVPDACRFCRRTFRRGALPEHQRSCLMGAPSSLQSNGDLPIEGKQDIQATPPKAAEVITAQPQNQRGNSHRSEEASSCPVSLSQCMACTGAGRITWNALRLSSQRQKQKGKKKAFVRGTLSKFSSTDMSSCAVVTAMIIMCFSRNKTFHFPSGTVIRVNSRSGWGRSRAKAT